MWNGKKHAQNANQGPLVASFPTPKPVVFTVHGIPRVVSYEEIEAYLQRHYEQGRYSASKRESLLEILRLCLLSWRKSGEVHLVDLLATLNDLLKRIQKQRKFSDNMRISHESALRSFLSEYMTYLQTLPVVKTKLSKSTPQSKEDEMKISISERVKAKTTHWVDRVLVFKVHGEDKYVPYPEFEKWVKEMAEKGAWHPNKKSTIWSTGRAALLLWRKEGPVAMDDFLANLDQLMDDFQQRQKFSDTTKRQYKQTLEHALLVYQQFTSNPSQFILFKKKQRNRSVIAAIQTPAPAPTPTADSVHLSAPRNVKQFEIKKGRVIEFLIPDELTQHEAQRFYFHLMSHAIDFNPMDLIGAHLIKDPLARLHLLEQSVGSLQQDLGIQHKRA